MDLVWTVPYCITDEDAEFGNIVQVQSKRPSFLQSEQSEGFKMAS